MRLDAYLTEKGYYKTKTKAAQAIRRGEVFVGGIRRIKPSKSVSEADEIEIIAERSFVSVGGFKLDKAIEDFGLDCRGLTFADIGASTGGFTDALLKRGAKKVFCIDVGKDLLDEGLRDDERVVVMDETNARYLEKEDFPCEIDAVVVDCSFISIKLLLPALKRIVKPDGIIIALIKPQFECGEKNLSKSGIVLGKKTQAEVVSSIIKYCSEQGLTVSGLTFAPLDKKKNIEYLVRLGNRGESVEKERAFSVIDEAIKRWKNL